MAKFLRDLLDAQEPTFTLALQQLEAASGKHGIDAQLIGDILQKAHAAMRDLQLDPKDTTGKELYQSLIARVKASDEHLAQSIGARGDSSIQELLPLMKAAAEKVKMPRDAWVIKKSVARDMLRKMPPPNIMKLLGHKSVESMLKNENLYEVYGALRFAEGGEWLNEFNQLYKDLTPSDFETRQIEIVIMDHDTWGDIAEPFIHKKRHNITHLKELGVILMLPIKSQTLPGITLWAMSLLFHYTNEIRLYSAYFKLQQVQKNFGEIFVNTLIADPASAAVMAGQHVHWRVIQRYFGKLENENHPEIFQPHVQPEDLHWRKAEAVIADIDPELAFWHSMDYVGLMFENRPVTFNMMDVAAAYCNDTPYDDRVIYHFRESLWNEIFMRYMGQKVLEDQILKQLDNSMIAPEKL